MGPLSFFQKPTAPNRFPRGSFSVDRSGRVTISTLPATFSASRVGEITQAVLATFRTAREAGVPLNEFTVNFAGLQIRARDLSGGAMIFLVPKEF
jgi:hypothetical protein